MFSDFIEYNEFIYILEEICSFENNRFYFDKTIFNKLLYTGFINDLLIYIKPFYFKSKHHYIDRGTTYNGFMTIIRQLCNLHNINFERKIKYHLSNCESVYIFNLL